jgi:outer membrane protein OmpA-like peptidoglycan-associated protein
LAGLRFGSGETRPDTASALDSLAEILRLYPGTRLEIFGHTDDQEGPDRQSLSLRRAEFAKAYLESLGIAPERLQAFGAGDSRPLQPNRSGAARMGNRRVELRAR